MVACHDSGFYWSLPGAIGSVAVVISAVCMGAETMKVTLPVGRLRDLRNLNDALWVAV
jgi:hypothetical protein